MKIGSVRLVNNLILAPLAGITNLPFRLLAKEAGCGLVCSEMISAKGLVHGSQRTLGMLESAPEERPLSVQLFGADPAVMAEAARIAETAGADLLDINFGCSVKKITKTGAGAALMKEPERAEAVIRAVRGVVRIPLTIKLRSGWDASGDQALETARIAEAEGVDAVTVHPRTARQGFRGCADWSIIGRVKARIRLPVIGNGDITGPEDAARMLRETGCDGIMIGRAAVGNPWIFAAVSAHLDGRAPASAATPEARFAAMEKYLDASIRYFGEAHACRMMRSRLGWFSKGMAHGSRFRESIKRIASRREALERIADFREALIRETPPSPWS